MNHTYTHLLNPVRQLRRNAIRLLVRMTSVASAKVNAAEVSHCHGTTSQMVVKGAGQRQKHARYSVASLSEFVERTFRGTEWRQRRKKTKYEVIDRSRLDGCGCA